MNIKTENKQNDASFHGFETKIIKSRDRKKSSSYVIQSLQDEVSKATKGELSPQKMPSPKKKNLTQIDKFYSLTQTHLKRYNTNKPPSKPPNSSIPARPEYEDYDTHLIQLLTKNF